MDDVMGELASLLSGLKKHIGMRDESKDMTMVVSGEMPMTFESIQTKIDEIRLSGYRLKPWQQTSLDAIQRRADNKQAMEHWIIELLDEIHTKAVKERKRF